MFSRLFKKRTHSKDGFPLVVKEHWYTGAWYSWLCDQDVLSYGDRMSGDKANSVSPATGTIAFNHYRCGIHNNDESNLVDGLIPALRIGNLIGLYKITRQPYSRTEFMSDRLGWDDGKYIDLKFVNTIQAGEYNHND